MSDGIFILVPLLVLPIILLFRFVGCGLDMQGQVDEPVTTPLPAYRDIIMGEKSDIVAYWRLVDEGETKAKDEGPSSLDGDYTKVPGGLDPAAPGTFPGYGGSQYAPGDFTLGLASLIAFDSAKGRAFDGGHVRVPGFGKKDALGFAQVPYPEEFTIEAWISPQWTEQPGYEHTLIGAGGRYQKPSLSGPPSAVALHGFRIFADRQNEPPPPNSIVDPHDRWRVYLAPVTDLAPPVGVVPMDAPIVAHHKKTHLAVTVGKGEGSKKKVTLFVDGKKFSEGIADSYSRPDGAPLFIGVTNVESDPSILPKPRHAVLSPIQEVVLYKTVLDGTRIKAHFDRGTLLET